MPIEIQIKKPVIELGIPSGGSGTSVPKPLTYDYMPEGYPTKSMQTITLMEEREVAFVLNYGVYGAQLIHGFKVVEGQKYTVNWDGTEYECVGVISNSMSMFGNLSIMGMGGDTGEPFLYGYIPEEAAGTFVTLDTAASHTISVKTTEETVTPMAKEFLPAGGSGGVQPDWNQNDSTAADYVKNRPFYTGDPMETVLVEESTISFADTGEGYYGAKFPSTFVPTVGETYKVSWDGATYECICVSVEDTRIIGNLSIIGDYSDTGEPFLMTGMNGNEIQIGTKDTSASHTFSISGTVAQVVKIDEKYLPDTVAAKSDVKSAQATADIAQGIANNARAIANNAQIAADNAQTAANNAQTAANNAQTAANNAVKPAKQVKDGCIYFMHNPYADYKYTGVVIGTSGGTALGIEVNKEQYPSVAFVPPVHGFNQADFEFRRLNETYPHPLITGIGGIVVYSSTPKSTKKFKITVDDSGTLKATEVTSA